MGGDAVVRLLLDTHIWLWSLLEPSRLPEGVAAELENPSNELWLSPISVWELLMLVKRGRIVLDMDPENWVRRVFLKVPFKEAPLNHEVAIKSHCIRFSHRDPADRFLAATALVYDLTFVTADERILNSQVVTILPNV
jgi:PIN domain nuclease of toxin-antitoxin system